MVYGLPLPGKSLPTRSRARARPAARRLPVIDGAWSGRVPPTSRNSGQGGAHRSGRSARRANSPRAPVIEPGPSSTRAASKHDRFSMRVDPAAARPDRTRAGRSSPPPSSLPLALTPTKGLRAGRRAMAPRRQTCAVESLDPVRPRIAIASCWCAPRIAPPRAGTPIDPAPSIWRRVSTNNAAAPQHSDMVEVAAGDENLSILW